MNEDTSIIIEYGNSLSGKAETDRIVEILKEISSLDGDICEVGVYRGGTAKYIVDNSGGSDVFLFDTFEGMPYYDQEKDKRWGIGSFGKTDFEIVKNLFSDKLNVKIYKGIFPSDTSYNIKNNKFKFVHLDVDNYQSYKECLEFFYDRMVEGGIMVFDDYDHECCPGSNRAIDEFFSSKEEKIQKNISAFIVKL